MDHADFSATMLQPAISLLQCLLSQSHTVQQLKFVTDTIMGMKVTSEQSMVDIIKRIYDSENSSSNQSEQIKPMTTNTQTESESLEISDIITTNNNKEKQKNEEKFDTEKSESMKNIIVTEQAPKKSDENSNMQIGTKRRKSSDESSKAARIKKYKTLKQIKMNLLLKMLVDILSQENAPKINEIISLTWIVSLLQTPQYHHKLLSFQKCNLLLPFVFFLLLFLFFFARKEMLFSVPSVFTHKVCVYIGENTPYHFSCTLSFF